MTFPSRLLAVCAVVAIFAAQAPAQTPASTAVIGAVSAVRPDASEIDVKQDNGAATVVRFTAATAAQKVAPGQTDLSKAASIKVTEVSPGDRVLVTLDPAVPGTARRIIVMASSDLAKHDAED